MRAVEERACSGFQRAFGRDPEIVSSAPGRVNLIGEHTDYNEGFVLPCAIDRRVAMAGALGEGRLLSLDLIEERPLSGKDGSWADYTRGVVWAVRSEGGRIQPFDAAITGDVPRGGGLSSSAALEAATAMLLEGLFDLDVDLKTWAILCRRAENQYVGVPTGIMDQYASLLCEAGAALLIDCRTLDAEPVPLRLEEAGLTLLVCDTRVERRLTGSEYAERREACERAAEQLAYRSLRDATVEDLERLDGVELMRTRHVVSENARVLAAVEALKQDDFVTFGLLMDASHVSLRDDFQVSHPALDLAVETMRDAGALGARLTGAGFGGCAIGLLPVSQVSHATAALERAFSDAGLGAPACFPVAPSAGADYSDL